MSHCRSVRQVTKFKCPEDLHAAGFWVLLRNVYLWDGCVATYTLDGVALCSTFHLQALQKNEPE